MCRSNVAVLHVYYKAKTGERYKTDIRYGIEDFICKYSYVFQEMFNFFTDAIITADFNISAAMGGLLGLGLGLSFISVIELLYFLCLRCFCRSRIRRSVDVSRRTLNPLQLSRRKIETSKCSSSSTTSDQR